MSLAPSHHSLALLVQQREFAHALLLGHLSVLSDVATAAQSWLGNAEARLEELHESVSLAKDHMTVVSERFAFLESDLSVLRDNTITVDSIQKKLEQVALISDVERLWEKLGGGQSRLETRVSQIHDLFKEQDAAVRGMESQYKMLPSMFLQFHERIGKLEP